jgi:hypothetical protein
MSAPPTTPFRTAGMARVDRMTLRLVTTMETPPQRVRPRPEWNT